LKLTEQIITDLLCFVLIQFPKESVTLFPARKAVPNDRVFGI
jgi:hypothetical protein